MDVIPKLSTRIVNKIEQLPEKDWNSAFPRVAESYCFFKTLDESSFDQFSFFYILIYDNNIPVGAASCFLMNFPVDISVRGPLKIIFNLIKKIAPRIMAPKVLICGLPMGPGRIGIVRDSAQVLEAICGCLEEISAKNKASMIMFKDFTESDEDVFEPLYRRGFSKLESYPFTQMQVPFNSFGEYLKTLSRSSRENLKRNFKKVDNTAEIDFETRGSVDDGLLKDVYGLYMQTYDKQEMGFEKLPMDFFQNISKNMPDETKFFLWRIKGKLVAFALCFVFEDCFIDYYLGFDYAVAHSNYLYFVRFRDLMQWCIDHGLKKYEMGVTSYESKRRLGFDFVRFYFYMKHLNPIVNRFFGVISYFLKPRSFDPVFKHMTESS